MFDDATCVSVTGFQARSLMSSDVKEVNAMTYVLQLAKQVGSF
ncbi:hypothetical protein C4J99_0180 [Pseudomonas synxantha]|nr:hypothetical protein C4J99_0180 [Pseudomonas synxantha]